MSFTKRSVMVSSEFFRVIIFSMLSQESLNFSKKYLSGFFSFLESGTFESNLFHSTTKN